MSMCTVNENSALFLTFSFADENDVPIVPNSIDWRIDDVTDKHNPIEITAWTPVGVPATSVDIQVPASSNAISTANTNKVFELRVVRVRMDDGQSTEAHNQKFYRVKNLVGAP